LNIDSSFYTQCQKAANDAITKLCGSEDSCDKIAETKIMVENPLSVVFDCTKDGKKDEFVDLNLLTDDEAKTCSVRIAGKINVEKMDFKESGLASNTGGDDEETARNRFVLDDDTETNDFLTRAKDKLNSSFDLYYSQAASDQTVKYCTEGRSVQGFDKENNFGDATKAKERFPNLLNSLQVLVGEQLLDNFYNEYYERLSAAETERQNQVKALSERLLEIAKKEAAEEKKQEQILAARSCDQYKQEPSFKRESGYLETTRVTATYDAEKDICKVTTEYYECSKRTLIKRRNKCKKWPTSPNAGRTTTKEYPCVKGVCK